MKQKHSVSVVCYTIAGLAALITIFPLYWTLITSFKTYKEAFAQPPDFFTAVSLDNYIAFLKQNNILLYLKNSIIISVFSVLIPLILGLFASYVITRSSIPGKEGFSMFLIASRFIPPASTLIPTFFSMVLPLCKPGIAATAVLSFCFSWNEFMYAMNLTSTEAKTLPLAMMTYMGESGNEWQMMATAGIVILLPTIIFTVLTHRNLGSGMSFGSVKE